MCCTFIATGILLVLWWTLYKVCVEQVQMLDKHNLVLLFAFMVSTADPVHAYRFQCLRSNSSSYMFV